MEPTENPVKSSKNKIIIIAIVALAAIAAGTHYLISKNSFCYTFAHNSRFGDNRVIENPPTQGSVVRKGIEYFPLDVPALQTELTKEGFVIDELELTGGGIYFTSFYGPSTQAAVRGFQKKYGLEETAWVDNATIDKLNELYGCKVSETATSTPQTASSTSAQATTTEN